MKLGAALSKLKSEKSQLARLMKIRKEVMYVKENEKPSFNVKKLTDQINRKIDDIRSLKVKIMKTNLQTKVSGITLAEAIIKIGDLRSKISNLTNLIEFRNDSWLFGRREKEVNYKPQIKESVVEQQIKKLEQEKVKLDNDIQKVNWTTDLIE